MLYKDLEKSNSPNYMKHIRVLVDQIIFNYYELYKTSDIFSIKPLELCEFSACVYEIFDKSKNIFDFIIRIRNNVQYIKSPIRRKYINLVKSLSSLEKFENEYFRENNKEIL